MTYTSCEIAWKTIEPIWTSFLWPNRVSPIKGHSSMTWPYDGNPLSHDMSIYNYPATYWGVYFGDQLVAVNSGHKTGDRSYRSRGLWVDPLHRKKGLAQRVLELTQKQALLENCKLLWSIPREQALSAYYKFGFITLGDYFTTETAISNIYVFKSLEF